MVEGGTQRYAEGPSVGEKRYRWQGGLRTIFNYLPIVFDISLERGFPSDEVTSSIPKI